jgi:hypothetical protein
MHSTSTQIPLFGFHLWNFQILRLDGYQFDQSADGGRKWSSKDMLSGRKLGRLSSPERIALGITNLGVWLKHMDWSHIHTLAPFNPSANALSKLSDDTLPSLKHLGIIDKWGGQGNMIIDFITKNSPPLESISLRGMNLGFDDDFMYHSELRRELRSFVLRPDDENYLRSTTPSSRNSSRLVLNLRVSKFL